MSPCDILLQPSMKSFASFHVEPEAGALSAKPLMTLFILVPLQEVLGECTGPVSLSSPWQSSLPGLYHLAVTPRVPLLPEGSLHFVLVMNALMVDDHSMVVSLGGFASISRAEWGSQCGSGMRLHFSSSSRIGSSLLESCSAWHLPYLRGTEEYWLKRVLDWSGSSFLQLKKCCQRSFWSLMKHWVKQVGESTLPLISSLHVGVCEKI